MATVNPISPAQGAIEAELERFADQGLDPISSGDLSSDVPVPFQDQPALLINTRAHVSVLANAAAGMAGRLTSLLELAGVGPEGGFSYQQAHETAFHMASELRALVEIVAAHPSVISAPSLSETAS